MGRTATERIQNILICLTMMAWWHLRAVRDLQPQRHLEQGAAVHDRGHQSGRSCRKFIELPSLLPHHRALPRVPQRGQWRLRQTALALRMEVIAAVAVIVIMVALLVAVILAMVADVFPRAQLHLLLMPGPPAVPRQKPQQRWRCQQYFQRIEVTGTVLDAGGTALALQVARGPTLVAPLPPPPPPPAPMLAGALTAALPALPMVGVTTPLLLKLLV
mmetsp:Transcript_6242/g.10416  ORF Transcript_6242/g.10416 Transcript_6242/m.10416 type:complete len:217 (+) Transcript_6242:444-1094(+)